LIALALVMVPIVQKFLRRRKREAAAKEQAQAE
jgi:hypothetical protein